MTAHVGCSGWNYASWRGTVYPPGLAARRWLARYAEWFDTVEVNATFYRLVTEATTARWVVQTPPGFQFAVKASRYLTHVRRLRDIEAGVARFYGPLEPLVRAGRLGPVLWQLPPTFHRDEERLAAALDRLPAGRHAVEFRHDSWFADDVYALLRERDVALVAADDPRRPSPLDVVTATWRYVRLHYGHRGRRGNYARSELAAWAARIAEWREESFVYFNNDWEAFAPRNARVLRGQLGTTPAEAPA